MSIDAMLYGRDRDDVRPEWGTTVDGDGDWVYPTNHDALKSLVGQLLTQLEAMGLNSTQLKATKSIFNRVVYGWFEAVKDNCRTAAPLSAHVPLRTDDGFEKLRAVINEHGVLQIRHDTSSTGSVIGELCASDLPRFEVLVDGVLVDAWSIVRAALETSDKLTILVGGDSSTATDGYVTDYAPVVRGRTMRTKRIDLHTASEREQNLALGNDSPYS